MLFLCVCMCVYTQAFRGQRSLLCIFLNDLYFKTGPLTGSGAHQLLKLAGQWAPRTPLSLPYQHRDYRHVLPCLVFLMCAGDLHLVPHASEWIPHSLGHLPILSPILWMDRILFIQSLDDGYGSCLCLLSIINNVVMNIHLWVFTNCLHFSWV